MIFHSAHGQLVSQHLLTCRGHVIFVPQSTLAVWLFLPALLTVSDLTVHSHEAVYTCCPCTVCIVLLLLAYLM